MVVRDAMQKRLKRTDTLGFDSSTPNSTALVIIIARVTAAVSTAADEHLEVVSPTTP